MKAIIIILTKALSFVGRLIGKGTSLPGKIALKLCPTILSQLTLPKNVIAVTGSNGKTSTVEMIAYILTASGKDVVYNKEGSNQIEGVATLLICNSNLRGKVRGDAVILESDERYARHTFKYIKPTCFAVTNLYRDQLTRNAHPYRIYDILQDAVDLVPDATLLLNADDPIVRGFGKGRDKVLYFGMEQNAYSTTEQDGIYNDCYYCPNCKEEMTYKFFHYAHLGDYTCENCGYTRPERAYTVDTADLNEGAITVNGNKISLAFASRYNVYNLCAAFAAASIAGAEGEAIAAAMSDFVMKNGRIVTFKAGNNQGLLITSKHENSTSYNQSLEYVCNRKENCDLYIIVDAISRKYYTAETSWLWDIAFEKIAKSNVKRVTLCGSYANDLAVRFSVMNLGDTEVVVQPDLDEMAKQMADMQGMELYVITCFSDKDKLFSRVDVQTPVAK